ncbi:MAG: hypothetical protein JSW47_01140 [Phycisphaerales bacterium]|nr:MAG: hypothetical protein JSW47_01140 [Phycisphaerales bacterium]
MANAPESLYVRLKNRQIYAIRILCCDRRVDKKKFPYCVLCIVYVADKTDKAEGKKG